MVSDYYGLYRTWVNLRQSCLAHLIRKAQKPVESTLHFPVQLRRHGQGTKSEKGERWVERILSLRETSRLRGQMLASNPLRMDYYRTYQEIIADYNREKDRATVEATFAQLLELTNSLDAEQRRAVEEGLSESEIALFDLLRRDDVTKAQREALKQASKGLLASPQELLAPLERWTEQAQTQAEVKVFILDRLFEVLPRPPFSEKETEADAERVYDFVWQRGSAGWEAGAELSA